jgi:hypothetical protein
MDLPKIESRMLRWMLAVAAVSLVAILARGHWPLGCGFALGALIGILNFHWLWQTANTLMGAQSAHVPFRTAALMIVRYPLALAVLALLYIWGRIPLLPLIGGLLVPGAGVVIESLILAGAELSHKQTA